MNAFLFFALLLSIALSALCLWRMVFGLCSWFRQGWSSRRKLEVSPNSVAQQSMGVANAVAEFVQFMPAAKVMVDGQLHDCMESFQLTSQDGRRELYADGHGQLVIGSNGVWYLAKWNEANSLWNVESTKPNGN